MTFDLNVGDAVHVDILSRSSSKVDVIGSSHILRPPLEQRLYLRRL